MDPKFIYEDESRGQKKYREEGNMKTEPDRSYADVSQGTPRITQLLESSEIGRAFFQSFR